MGNLSLLPPRVVKTCACQLYDFEWFITSFFLMHCRRLTYLLHSEFNHKRSDAGHCQLIPGLKARPSNDSCPSDAKYWFDRTPYRRIALSKCESGISLDVGEKHSCHNRFSDQSTNLDPFEVEVDPFKSHVLLLLIAAMMLWVSYSISKRSNR